MFDKKHERGIAMKPRVVVFWALVPVFSWCLATVAMGHLYWSQEKAGSMMDFLCRAAPVDIVFAGVIVAVAEIKRCYDRLYREENGAEQPAAL